MSSFSLLFLVAILICLVFLYSNGLYPINDGLLNTGPLATKALLSSHDLNAHLSPHIYNLLIQQEYRLRELFHTSTFHSGDSHVGNTCLEHVAQFCSSGEWFRVAQVSFPDSEMEWTLCHCVTNPANQRTQDPDQPWSYLVSHLLRLPVPLRRQIGTVMLVPLSHSPLLNPKKQQQSVTPHGMFTTSPPLVTFFGYPTIGTWIHEFAHSADFHHSSTMFSTSEQWATALEKDSCVADEYARTSPEEALAQAAIIKSYLAGRPRGSSAYSSRKVDGAFTAPSYPSLHDPSCTDALLGDYSCMKHQLTALSSLESFYASPEDGTCVDDGLDMPKHERKELVSRSGTWWELWLITDLVIVLFMLAQL